MIHRLICHTSDRHCQNIHLVEMESENGVVIMAFSQKYNWGSIPHYGLKWELSWRKNKWEPPSNNGNQRYSPRILIVQKQNQMKLFTGSWAGNKVTAKKGGDEEVSRPSTSELGSRDVLSLHNDGGIVIQHNNLYEILSKQMRVAYSLSCTKREGGTNTWTDLLYRQVAASSIRETQ